MKRRFVPPAWLLTAALLSACSFLVTPEKSEPRCSIGSDRRDPCPQGSVCRNDRCVTAVCESKERCGNGIDDDCDHEIDERDPNEKELCDTLDNDCDGISDEGHDNDGDGRTWCGDLINPATRDCDELNKKVSPDALEVCDGIDNDCNGLTDEPPAKGRLCERADQTCLAGSCVSPGCNDPLSGGTCPPNQGCVDDQCVPTGCTSTSCGPGRVCNAQTGVCTPEVKLGNGDSCTRASDCRSGTCIDANALRFTGGGRVCAQACCVDSDCPADESCFASGTGARSCLRGARSSRATRQCSSDQECGGQACALGAYPGIVNGDAPEIQTTVCRTRMITEGQPGDLCYADDSCASQVCIPGPVYAFVGACSTPCRTSNDCQPLRKYYPSLLPPETAGVAYSYCRFVDTTEIIEESSDEDFVAFCVISRSDTGNGDFGAPCASGSACRDGACVGATGSTLGYCAPTCCNDQQCTAMGRSGARCLPIARGGHYEMRCVQ